MNEKNSTDNSPGLFAKQEVSQQACSLSMCVSVSDGIKYTSHCPLNPHRPMHNPLFPPLLWCTWLTWLGGAVCAPANFYLLLFMVGKKLKERLSRHECCVQGLRSSHSCLFCLNWKNWNWDWLWLQIINDSKHMGYLRIEKSMADKNDQKSRKVRVICECWHVHNLCL